MSKGYLVRIYKFESFVEVVVVNAIDEEDAQRRALQIYKTDAAARAAMQPVQAPDDISVMAVCVGQEKVESLTEH